MYKSESFTKRIDSLGFLSNDGFTRIHHHISLCIIQKRRYIANIILFLTHHSSLVKLGNITDSTRFFSKKYINFKK